MNRTIEELFSGIIWGSLVGALFLATCTAGCAADAGQVPIPELNCAKDPCAPTPEEDARGQGWLACPLNNEGDIYIRHYDTCTCTCTKEYSK